MTELHELITDHQRTFHWREINRIGQRAETTTVGELATLLNLTAEAVVRRIHGGSVLDKTRWQFSPVAKIKKVFDSTGREWTSTSEAGTALGIRPGTIREAIYRRGATRDGRYWSRASAADALALATPAERERGAA